MLYKIIAENDRYYLKFYESKSHEKSDVACRKLAIPSSFNPPHEILSDFAHMSPHYKMCMNGIFFKMTIDRDNLSFLAWNDLDVPFSTTDETAYKTLLEYRIEIEFALDCLKGK